MAFKRAEIETLVNMANELDAKGLTEQSQQLDIAIAKIVQAAKEEEEDEKASRQMSGKAKAKFRAVKKACESLCQADLDYRGPHKSQCRKVEMLAEEIVEAIKDCDFE